MSNKPLSLRLVVPTVLLYGAGYPLGSATVAVMSPFLVVFLRFAVSAAVVWVIVAARRTPLPPVRLMLHAVVAGIFTQAVQFLGLYWALDNGVSSGLASLLIALNPVVTATLLSLVLGHRESSTGVLSLVLGTAAVILACAPKLMADHSIGIAIVAVVVAMLGLSAGGIYQGRFCAGMDPWMITAIGLTASTPIAAIAAMSAPIHTTDWPHALALLAAMIILSSVGATTLYAACIKRSGARAASILFAVIPAAASVMAWIALGEHLSAFTLAALVLGAAACILQGRTPPVSARDEGNADSDLRSTDQYSDPPVSEIRPGQTR